MNIIKRNGNKEPFNVDKIHRVLDRAVEGLDGVNTSDIEFNAKLSIVDGTPSKEIHDILIRSANDLISEANPNYQYVAARLLLYSLRKQVWGESEPPRLLEHIKKCVKAGVYDAEILSLYTESEIHKIGKFLNHKRDDRYTYSGLQQLVDKYLLKNRDSGQIYETPQFALILIAMTLFAKYNAEKKLSYIKKCYEYLSKFKISLPTPIMCGVRTPIRQYASCILIDVADSMKSIFSSNTAVGYYTAQRAGIGLNMGRIRPINSKIRNGEVVHTGVIPFLKVFESTAKSCSQNGVRGGGGTVHFPFWHYEIKDILVLKNNSGTDDNRVRKLDYSVQFSKIFYERVIENKDITLFSPAECPELFENFGLPEFDKLYVQREKDKTLKFKKKIKARSLAELFNRERLETGRIYLMNLDHCNSHSSWEIPIRMSNLCQEITHPTIPLTHIDDEQGEIGVCILSAINVLETKLEELPEVCDIIVRLLDAVIDYQTYPVKAAENFAKNKRSIAVGITNLAAYLAQQKVFYDDGRAPDLVDRLAEHIQYNLLTASCNLAQEMGKCPHYNLTKYAEGKLPIDHYSASVDDVCKRPRELDWESLRKSIAEHGLRHSSLTAQMPCDSSSVIQNSTNGIEPVRTLLSFKKSKQGLLKQLVPNYAKYKDYYTPAFTLRTNTELINIIAVLQKWFDMSISANAYYNYGHYPEGKIPLSVMTKDMLYMYKMGVKTLYYTNSPDGDSEKTSCGESGACAI